MEQYDDELENVNMVPVSILTLTLTLLAPSVIFHSVGDQRAKTAVKIIQTSIK